jgi:threonine dehydrogenase-like Zn-dependent dehydrogenase
LLKVNVGPGSTALIDEISRTLGLGAIALALAMGARKVLGTARNQDLFQKVKCLAAPGRIEIHTLGTNHTNEWALEAIHDEGADVVIDALGPGAPYESLTQVLKSLHRGGHLVNIGAIAAKSLSTFTGSWTTTSRSADWPGSPPGRSSHGRHRCLLNMIEPSSRTRMLAINMAEFAP